jgi:RNA polymerase primary sigma factor
VQKQQRNPTADELSEIISLEIDKIEKAIQTEAHVNSLDAPVSEDADSTMADVMASSPEYAADRTVNHESMCSDLMQVLCNVLNERERLIVIQNFGIGCPERNLDDIGYGMGLTRERVRQIRERSLDKVRKCDKSKYLLRHLA